MSRSQPIRLFIAFAFLFSLVLGVLSNCALADEPDATNPDTTNIDGTLTIEDIKVEGNRLVPTEDILGQVKSHKGDQFDRDKVLADLKAINGMGYFDDRNLQVLPERTAGGVLLKIRVQENAPITEFSFQGNQVIPTEEINKIFADQLGKPQNLNELSAAIDKVEEDYHEKGYILARVTDVKNDPDGSVGLTINEGVIDKIEIVGNRKTKDFIIKNAIKLKPNSVYNERQLTNDLRKLFSNGYFQDIRRSIAPSNNSDKYILKVEVDEKRTGSVGLGGGVDTVAGPFGSLSFSDANFLGRGQILSMNAQAGAGMLSGVANTINNGGTNFLANQRTYQVSTDFIEPSIRGTNNSMALSGYARDYNSLLVDNSMQRTLGASLTFSRPLGDHFSASLGFAGENTSLSDLATLADQTTLLQQLSDEALKIGKAATPQAAQALAQQVRSGQLKGGTYFSINPSLHYDTRDNKLDPRHGVYAKLTASPSLGVSGSSFAKLGASISKYVPVTRNSTLALNVQGGTALGNVPQFGNYWLGGWNGLRGYRAFTDLGTGSSMLMASAELRTKLPLPKFNPHDSVGRIMNPIIDHTRGVFFLDAGQISGNSLTNSLYQRSTLGASVGVGLRVNVPVVGVIRLDWGLPLVSSLLGHFTPRFSLGFGEKI